MHPIQVLRSVQCLDMATIRRKAGEKKRKEDIMEDKRNRRVLTINSGSSSLKFSIYHAGTSLELKVSGELERIGLKDGLFRIRDFCGRQLVERELEVSDHEAALKELLEWMESYPPAQNLDAAGHRIVHGGSEYRRPHWIDPSLLEELQKLIPLAPEHLPHEIRAVQALARLHPVLRQAACFDTSFHASIPKIARLYPLPREYWEQGVRRYGFHGLSYEYIMEELETEAGKRAAQGRIVIAHLGNGASMTAVHKGRSVETTMGFTPSGGLVMGTRTGDLDPGVILFLLEEKGLSLSEVKALVNHRGGLLGVSGLSSSMKDLLDKEAEDSCAAEAVSLFCFQAKKFLTALASVLGGLDTLVFTGGIGENAPSVRWQICKGLDFMGIFLDRRENRKNSPVISHGASPVTVRVIKTDEELMVARHTSRLLQKPQG
jgi:acetate kinase